MELKHRAGTQSTSNIALVPLGTPLLAGPGAIVRQYTAGG